MSNKKEIMGVVGRAKRKFLEINKSSMGNDMVWQKESNFAMQIIQQSTHLQAVPPESVVNAIVNIAAIGLSLNPAEKLAYLVPRSPGQGMPMQCCLDVSYKGIVKLATDSGSVVWAKCELVYKDDDFTWEGMDKMPTHRFDPFNKVRGDLVGTFTAAKLHDGSYLVDHMSLEEISKIQDTSKAKKGPWKTWYLEMVKKTGIRRASKSWPHSARMMLAESELNVHQGIDEDQPAQDAVRLVSEDQLSTLNNLMTEAKMRPDRILKAFQIEKMEDLPYDRFEECKARLEAAKEAHSANEQEASNG